MRLQVQLAFFTLLTLSANSQDGLVDLPSFREGCQALADHRFGSATEYFSKTWEMLEAGEAGGIEKNLVASRLLESMVRNDDSATATEWMAKHTLLSPPPNTVYWMARALKAEERFAEAAELFQTLATNAPDAFLYERAVCIARSGDTEEAFALIKDHEPDGPAEVLASARIAMDAGETEAAEAFLKNIEPEFAELLEAPSRKNSDFTVEDPDFKEASEAYLDGRFDEAAAKFSELAEEHSGEKRNAIRFNTAVAALQAGQIEAFEQQFRMLEKNAPRSPMLAELEYLGGLYLAAQGDPDAFAMLNAFVREHPDHPANVEGQLALAEIHLNQVPARPQAARKIFEGLRLRPLTLTQSERLDYSAVWTELIDLNASAVIERGSDFINDWPNSSYLPDILMIVATKLFEAGNLKGAREHFRRIAEEFPDAANARLAEFYATRSSPPHPDTVSEWQTIIEGNSPFSNSALHELGLLYLSLDQFADARAIFLSLIESEPGSSELLFAAQADLGFSYYSEALANENDPDLLGQAANVFAELSSNSEASRFWRFNSAVRRGKCIEAMGNPSVALEIYQSIVNEVGPTVAVAPSVNESEWISRAGFSAINILTEREDWAAAIKLAETLAIKEGPRAIEASRLAEQLRLKHWVWD